jgi:hypothetical protein
MECEQTRLVMLWESSIFAVAVAAEGYTLAVILHILRVDRGDNKRTGYTTVSLTVTRMSGGA